MDFLLACFSYLSRLKVEIKITQFADDTTLVLDGSQSSLKAALNTLEIFGSYSGLKMNTNKTKVIWIGRKKYSKDKLQVSVDLEWGKTHFNLLGIIFSVDLNEMITLNYSKALENSKKTLSFWNKQNLTPFGKIMVIKTFILSKFNHLFMTIPSPDNNFIKQLNSSLFAFLWDNKPDKIKREYITQDYINGGLRMVNIESFIQSLKLTWMNRLFKSESQPWSQLFEKTISPISKLALNGSTWCDILINKTQNDFWKETLISWRKLSDNTPISNSSDILASPLWYNPKISKMELNLPNWSKHGISYVGDLLHSNGNFISQKDLEQKYTLLKTNFLEYLRVKICVELYLKRYREEGPLLFYQPCLPKQIASLFGHSQGSKHFYKLLNKTCADMSFKTAWNNELNINIDEDTWQKAFKICFKLIQDNGLIWFQYRILHRILGTQKLLSKIGKTSTPKCLLCKSHPESIIHLFSLCPCTINFWDRVKVWIESRTGITLNLGPLEHILGYQQTDNFLSINVIILAVKTYIFSNSRMSRNLNIMELKQKIQIIYDEQKLLAKMDLKEEVFLKKWQLIEMLLH